MMNRSGLRTSLALLLSLSLATPSFAESESDPGQRQQYDDAAKACGNSKDSSMAAAGIWGVMAALCGYNCYNYYSLRAARTAVTKAADAALAAATHANTCVPGISAGVTALVGAVYSAYGLAEAEAGVAAAAAAAPVSSGATGAAVAGSHEAMVTQGTTLGSAQQANVAAVGTAQAGYCSNPYTSAQCANCTAVITELQTSVGALSAAISTLTTQMTSVITTGKYCQYGSFVAAAGDIALAATVGEDVSKGLMGIAGAAPGLIALLVANKTDTISMTTSAMGKSSCWTAGLGLVLAGIHAFQANESASCKDENEKKAKQLQDSKPVLGAASGKTNVSAVLGVGSAAIVSGSTTTAAPAVTSFTGSSSIFDVSSIVQNASQSDKAIARIVSKSPGTFNEAIQQASTLFGVPSSELLRPGNLNNDKLSAMISAPDPDTKGQVSALLASIDGRIGKGASQLAMTSPGTAGSSKSGSYGRAAGNATDGSGGPSFDLGTDAPGGVSGVATGTSVKKPGVNPNDEFHAGFTGTIFQIVSDRIDKSSERVEKIEWQLPVNRFQHGMSLQPAAKKKR
jgi:hypothetical protein